MFKWFIFIGLLTTGTVFYHYPSLYFALQDRVPVWLGITENPVLYRWQDENGDWRVAEQPPEHDVAYEKVKIRQDTHQLQVSQPNLP